MGVIKEGFGMRVRRNLGLIWVERWLGKDKFES